ncbi:hypothetical protein [Alkalibaculum sporogenes]|nr:hypothetical protein [Alkalibaculum sporogenes]
MNNKELIAELVSSPKYDSSTRVRRKLTDEIMDRINYLLKKMKLKK